jgi:hypothetical protein
MKRFIKVLSSNFRATLAHEEKFTGNSYPIWANGNADHWRFQWASYYLYHVFGYQLPLQ